MVTRKGLDMATFGDTELDGFIAKFSPAVAALSHALLANARAQFPDAVLLVCDNYNALAIGFGPPGRVKDVVFSLAIMPRWITLFFTWGVKVADPKKVLSVAGRQVRHVHLITPEAFDPPIVRHLIAQALVNAEPPIGHAASSGIVIKSISAK